MRISSNPYMYCTYPLFLATCSPFHNLSSIILLFLSRKGIICTILNPNHSTFFRCAPIRIVFTRVTLCRCHRICENFRRPDSEVDRSQKRDLGFDIIGITPRFPFPHSEKAYIPEPHDRLFHTHSTGWEAFHIETLPTDLQSLDVSGKSISSMDFSG